MHGDSSNDRPEAALARATMAKVTRRLLPLLVVCYFVAYLDRVNVSFAALTMNRDLGLSSSAFGFGAGIFFVSYFVFELPSNLMLARVGARRWIARIMFSWAIVSGAMAFVTNERGFYALRVLLGIAEAGFFPGIIYYLTLWFPARTRGRIIGLFMAAIPLSTVIGAPISGALLGLDGTAGLHGWQWMFVLEALPALLLALVVLRALVDGPADAAWLSGEERALLAQAIADDEPAAPAAAASSPLRSLLDRRVVLLSVVFFGAALTNYGLSFFLPQIVKGFGLSNLATGFVSAVPYVVGLIAILTWGRRSDRLGERRWHTAFPLFVASACLALSTVAPDPRVKMLAISLAGFGIFGCLPVFWTLPTSFLTGSAAAGGIAVINSVGNLAGFLGPSAMGAIRDATGGYDAGLIGLAIAGAIAGMAVLRLPVKARPVV